MLSRYFPVGITADAKHFIFAQYSGNGLRLQGTKKMIAKIDDLFDAPRAVYLSIPQSALMNCRVCLK